MSLKEYLINIKNKLVKNQNVETQEKREGANYIHPSTGEELNNILNNTISDFFPISGEWSSTCFKRPNENLPSNLRNNEFLAKKIQQKASLPDDYYNHVLAFINSSELFKQKVHEYE